MLPSVQASETEKKTVCVWTGKIRRAKLFGCVLCFSHPRMIQNRKLRAIWLNSEKVFVVFAVYVCAWFYDWLQVLVSTTTTISSHSEICNWYISYPVNSFATSRNAWHGKEGEFFIRFYMTRVNPSFIIAILCGTIACNPFYFNRKRLGYLNGCVGYLKRQLLTNTKPAKEIY